MYIVETEHDEWRNLSIAAGSFALIGDYCSPQSLDVVVGPTTYLMPPLFAAYHFTCKSVVRDLPLKTQSLGILTFKTQALISVCGSPKNIEAAMIRPNMLHDRETLFRQIELAVEPQIRSKVLSSDACSRVTVMQLGLGQLGAAFEPAEEQNNNMLTTQIEMGTEQELAALTTFQHSVGLYEGNLFEVSFMIEEPELSPSWKTKAADHRETLRKAVKHLRSYRNADQATKTQWALAVGEFAKNSGIDILDPTFLATFQAMIQQPASPANPLKASGTGLTRP